jgi:hypothetical protein
MALAGASVQVGEGTSLGDGRVGWQCDRGDRQLLGRRLQECRLCCQGLLDWCDRGWLARHALNWPRLQIVRNRRVGSGGVIARSRCWEQRILHHCFIRGSLRWLTTYKYSTICTLFPYIGSFTLCAAMVELVDTLDSKSGVHYGRAGSSPARGTKRSGTISVS